MPPDLGLAGPLDDFQVIDPEISRDLVVEFQALVAAHRDPHHPAPIDSEIIGDLARSEAVGKGAAYFHPTPGTDAFLMYYSWRFHEPIPVEDVQSITALFKQLSDLGLPPTKCFLELRELGEDSVFTVFSPKYEEWFEHIWY